MKRKVTKATLISYIKRLDTRCRKFEDDKFDDIIDDAFSEINTFQNFFYDEDALQITPYIDDGVKKLSYDVERDVTFVYDSFLSYDSKTPHPESDLHVEVDPRVLGRINIDFTSTVDMYKEYTYHEQSMGTNPSEPTTLITRYYYIPTSNFDEIYMNRDVYKAFRQAISSSAYLDLHDDEKSTLHYNRMKAYIKTIPIHRPLDFDDEKFFKGFIHGC